MNIKSGTTKILAAVTVGQFIQLILNILSRVAWMQNPVLFCLAAGFLVTVAVLSGVYLQQKEGGQPAHTRTYRDHASPPKEASKKIQELFGNMLDAKEGKGE